MKFLNIISFSKIRNDESLYYCAKNGENRCKRVDFKFIYSTNFYHKMFRDAFKFDEESVMFSFDTFSIFILSNITI